MVEALLGPADKTLETVRGHYPDALMTSVSLKSIGIRLNYHPNLEPAEADLYPGIIVPTQVIYLPGALDGFTRVFNQEEEKRLIGLGLLDHEPGKVKNALAKLTTLPEINGWIWRIPKLGLLARILENHLHEQDEYLLKGEYVWTEDTAKSARHRLVHLIAGDFGPEGLDINCVPGYGGGVGIFPVLLPEQSKSAGLHLVQE